MTEATHATIGADRIAGATLIAAAAVSVLAMAHHPTTAHSGALGPLVHTVMLAVLAAQLFGLTHFARRAGLGRSAILAGLVAYGMAAFAHFGAATVNGFVVPALAARGAAVDHGFFLFAWEANQALARIGVYATAVAYLFWSLDLVRRPSLEIRIVGSAGILAGAAPAILLGLGVIRMNVTGAALCYAAFGAWAALLGLQMLRGRLGFG